MNKVDQIATGSNQIGSELKSAGCRWRKQACMNSSTTATTSNDRQPSASSPPPGYRLKFTLAQRLSSRRLERVSLANRKLNSTRQL
jgi:hypothetical protein